MAGRVRGPSDPRPSYTKYIYNSHSSFAISTSSGVKRRMGKSRTWRDRSLVYCRPAGIFWSVALSRRDIMDEEHALDLYIH